MVGSISPTPPPARSYGGWALEQALAVDALAPGFLAASCRWGAGRRQVAFILFSRLHSQERVSILAERLDGALLERGVFVDPTSASGAIIGRVLLTLRPRKVLRAVLGGILPPGLTRTLARLGPEPLDAPEAYADVIHLFLSSDVVDRARVRVLGHHCGPLALGQIRALIATKPDLVHRAVLAHLRDPESARTFGDAVAYLRRCCSTATPEALRASLNAWPIDRDIKLWVRRWVERFDRPPGLDTLAQALAGRPGIRLLATGADLVAAQRRYGRNLHNAVGEVLVGRHAYVEYRPTTPGAREIVGILRWSKHGHVLTKIWCPKFEFARRSEQAALQRHLYEAGVIVMSRVPMEPWIHAAMSQWLDIHSWRLSEVDEPDVTGDDAEENA